MSGRYASFAVILTLWAAPLQAHAQEAPAAEEDEAGTADADAEGEPGAGAPAGAADDGVVEPGHDATPPGPAEPPPPTVTPSADHRRAVRGSPLDEVPVSAEREGLRQFEEQAFGGNGGPGKAWVPDATSAPLPSSPSMFIGKGDLPPELRSPSHPDRPAGLETAAARPDLPWLRSLKTGDLPVRWDPRVIRYLEFYRDDPRGRAIMTAWLRGKARYSRLIGEALTRHGLPQDLVYVCMIESSFDATTYSRVGASGLWQFMPGGGRIYGLQIDHWVDERNDPVKATEAALLYLRDLHARFGDWDFALAAYNAGYGAVLKSIAKYNTNDFWKLLDLESGLPWESSIYVPKALAAAIVGHNLAAFGYDTVVGAPAFEFDRVLVPRGVALSVVAAAAGVPTAEVEALNPHLRRRRTPPGGEYPVRIPRGRRERFARTFPQLRGDWDTVDAYVMRHGERFEDVARAHGVSTRQLRELNAVDDVAEVRGGTTIVVPKVDAATRARNAAAAEDDLYQSDVAESGPDDPMIVPVPRKDLVVPERTRVFYRVVAGDTLESVASVFGVQPGDLAAWNGLDLEARIHPRMVMQAWVPGGFDADKANVKLLDETRLVLVETGSPEHIDLFEGRKGRKRTLVTVKKGDTLESIGRPHGHSKYDMARINRRSYVTPLVPGEELVVYKVVDRDKARQAGVLKSVPKSKAKGGGKAGKPARGKTAAKPTAAKATTARKPAGKR